MASLLVRVVLGAGVATAAVVCDPIVVGAQPGAQPAPEAGQPSAADKQAARKLVDEGIAAMNARDYARALDLYQKAYALVPHPLMLFNIGQAHRLAGHLEQAASFYERYLAADPTGSEAGSAQAALAEVKAALAASRPGPVGAGDGGAPGQASDAGGPGAPPPPAVASAPPMRALEPDAPGRTDTVASPGRSLRVTGLVLGGVGIASLAAGGYFGLKVRGLEGEARDALASDPSLTTEALQARYGNDGDAAERNQFIAYGVAGALVLGGAVTYYLGYKQERTSRTTAWAPLLGRDLTGIALTGSLR